MENNPQNHHGVHPNNFPSVHMHKSCPFSVLYFNSRSVLPKIDELRALCLTHKPSVVCIVESWLDDSITNNELCIENYVIIRADRNRHGGGVLIYVLDNLSFNVIFPGSPNLELIIFSVTLAPPSPLKLTFGLFYRPPSSPSTIFDDILYSYIDVSFFSNFVLLGDFNVNMLDSSHPLFHKIQLLASSLWWSLNPHVCLQLLVHLLINFYVQFF